MPPAQSPNLPADVQKRLDRIWTQAYSAHSREDLRRLYRDWAATYDEDHDAIGFFGHVRTAEVLARYAPFADVAPVLDAGCGTGAAGEALASLGYRNLTGIDLSQDMLARARDKGIYTRLEQVDLGQPLDAFPCSSFDAAALVGVFSYGQAPAHALDEVVRVVKPGGVVAFTMRVDFYEQDAMSVRSRMEALDRAHAWKLLEVTDPEPYLPNKDPHALFRVFCYRVLETKTPPVDEGSAADVPVGCYLSGGIDSCPMLGLSAAVRQDPVRAFTIGFDSAEYDETPIAQEMARSVGAEQDVLRLDATSLYDHFVATHWHTERTIYNTLGVAKFLMSRHVRDVGYKVVITGEGSDELFAGYPSFRADLFRHGLDHLPAEERALLESGLARSNQVFQGAMLPPSLVDDPDLSRVCGFTPTCLQPWLHAAARVLPLVQEDRRRSLADYRPGAAIASRLDPDAVAGRHPLDVAQYVWIKTMLEGQILTWGGDRVDMAHSLEARPAFLDHHLAEYAATIPPHHRIRGAREKYVLREAVRGVLPKVLYEREKFAFMAPPAHTDPAKRAALQALAAEHLSPTAVADAGLLDRRGVEEILALYADESRPRAELVQLDAVINHMLGVQVLHRQLIADDVPARAAEAAGRADVVVLPPPSDQTGGTST